MNVLAYSFAYCETFFLDRADEAVELVCWVGLACMASRHANKIRLSLYDTMIRHVFTKITFLASLNSFKDTLHAMDDKPSPQRYFGTGTIPINQLIPSQTPSPPSAARLMFP